MKNQFSNQDMDRWSRNARLYRWLYNMGTVAVPIYAPDDSGHIEAIYVSVDLPPHGRVAPAETGPYPDLQSPHLPYAMRSRLYQERADAGGEEELNGVVVQFPGK